MTDERPQPPQGEPAAASQAPKRDQPEEAKAPEDMSYAQYLKLTHPDKSDEEIAKMVRKENRYTWLVRFQNPCVTCSSSSPSSCSSSPTRR